MARRRIVVFYHGDKNNAEITNSDYNQFYLRLKQNAGDKLEIDYYKCDFIEEMYNNITEVISAAENEELFFHFSGHGNQSGIPYSGMLFENEKMTNLLNHYKIKFCFFSSCKSAELVRLASEKTIPVVIGSIGDISNRYAINFQEKFYNALLASWNFEAAFKKAHDEIEQSTESKIEVSNLIRGEGSKLGDGQKLNALQIVFSNQDYKKMFLVPPDFLKEMANPKHEKPYLLAWFDDAGLATRFRTKFYKGGFSEQVYYIQIKDEELPLLNNRGVPDPFMETARLLICCGTNNALKPELKDHCSDETIRKMDHYKILFAHRQTIDPKTIFDDENLIPEKNRLSFNHVEELLADNGFLNELAEHKIPFSERRRMTLKINPRPLRKKLIDPPPEKFLRTYFGKTINEHLINFLVNYLKDQAPGNSNLVLLDNHQDPLMDFPAELRKEIKRIKPSDYENVSVTNFMADSFILVIRNRHKNLKDWEADVQKVLEIFHVASEGFISNRPKYPFYIFFLHDTEISNLPAGKTFLFAEQFPNPDPISDPILEEWSNLYSIENFGPIIGDEVLALIKTIPVRNFEKSCPSNAIAFICDALKIPRQQVIGI